MDRRSQNSCLINVDPDVIGVGIRVSLYVLSLSSHILTYAFGSAELSNAIESSLGVTGLALFLTTVIATTRHSLDLFHALCVFHLLGVTGLAIQPRGRYPTGVVHTYTFSTLYVLAAAGSLSYLIYVFTTAPIFGARPQCNDRTVYVLFGVNLPATNAVLRWLFVAVLTFLLLCFLLWLFLVTCTGCCVGLDSILGCHHSTQVGESDGTEEKRKGSPYPVIGQVAGSVYLIVMLELMIQRNQLGGGVDSWTFGQVLAMMMLLGPLIELVSLLLGKVDGDPVGQHTLETIAVRQRRACEG